MKTPETESHGIRAERILLMDDEKMIRDLVKEILSRSGYDTEVTRDGAETIIAYQCAMDAGNPFDLVLLDLTVEDGMGGKETVEKLLSIDHQVKAIVSSGYSSDPVMTDYNRYGFVETLPKPYSMKELCAVIEKVSKK